MRYSTSGSIASSSFLYAKAISVFVTGGFRLGCQNGCYLSCLSDPQTKWKSPTITYARVNPPLRTCGVTSLDSSPCLRCTWKSAGALTVISSIGVFLLGKVDLKATTLGCDRPVGRAPLTPLRGPPESPRFAVALTRTTMSSPPASPTQPYRPTKDDIAAAAIARISSSTEDDEDYEKQWARDKEKRQHFRRLVDPGIVRPNNEAIADACIEVRG